MRKHAALWTAFLFAAVTAACATGARAPLAPPEIEDPGLELPLADDSLRFAVVGDTGTGGGQQYEVAALMAAYHDAFPFELMLLLGDNLYGGEDPDDYRYKFEVPYQPLLDAGVMVYASLGNHDEPAQRMYEQFNMGGELYYSFAPEGHSVRFFALYTDYLDPDQLDWLDEALGSATERWKICFFHHPIYSSGGRHGPDVELREALEPLFIEHGVDVVFAGHEHFYERIKPQNGIAYFISGAGGKLRAGDVLPNPQTAAKYDEDGSFMLVEILDDRLHFQVISRDRRTVDQGALVDGPPVAFAEIR